MSDAEFVDHAAEAKRSNHVFRRIGHHVGSLTWLSLFTRRRVDPESRPKELHLRPLAERCVSLSTHTAPIRQTRRQYFDASVRTVCAACWQWTQSFGQPVFSAHYSAYTSALPTLPA